MKRTLNSWLLEDYLTVVRSSAVCCVHLGPPFMLMAIAKWDKLYNGTGVLAGIDKKASQAENVLEDGGLKQVSRHSERSDAKLKCQPWLYTWLCTVFICVWKVCSRCWRAEAADAGGIPLNNPCSSESDKPFYLMHRSLSFDYNHFQEGLLWSWVLAATTLSPGLGSRLQEHWSQGPESTSNLQQPCFAYSRLFLQSSHLLQGSWLPPVDHCQCDLARGNWEKISDSWTCCPVSCVNEPTYHVSRTGTFTERQLRTD